MGGSSRARPAEAMCNALSRTSPALATQRTPMAAQGAATLGPTPARPPCSASPRLRASQPAPRDEEDPENRLSRAAWRTSELVAASRR